MFLMLIVFVFVLVMSFAVVMLVTRPSTAERVIEHRIASLSGAVGEGSPPSEETVQIVKQRRLSDLPWLDALLRDVRPVQRLDLLIKQAESSWSVGGVLGGCVLLGMLGCCIGYYELSNALFALLPGALL